MQKVACVKLYDKGPSQLYAFERIELAPGDFCVVDCEGEEATGLVAGVESHCSPCRCDQTPYSTVLRKASDKEIEDWRRLKEREHQALIVCKDKVRQHNLPMSISSVRISEKQNKVTFRFTADRRIDFRELVKDLAGDLKARIELWQIGVRDEARNMDGYGICGRRLCCAAWIRDFKAITIRMAKHQELALSPSKLSGLCGRLMCCIQYEDEQYRRMQEEMPPLGAVIESSDVTGEVIDRHTLGQWLAVRDAAGNAYQVFNHEVVRVVSKPSRREAVETNATGGGEGAEDAVPEEEEENAPRSSRRQGAGYSGGSAPHAETLAYKGGIPPRPPSALKREEEARHAHEQKGMDRRMADLTARAARSEPRPHEAEGTAQRPAPAPAAAAAQACENAVSRETPPAVSTNPQTEPRPVERSAASANAIAPVGAAAPTGAAAATGAAAPAEERPGGQAPAASEERKERGGHWARRGRRGGRSRHKAPAGTAANAVSGAPASVPAPSAAPPTRTAGAPRNAGPLERAGGRRRRPRHRPLRQGPPPAG